MTDSDHNDGASTPGFRGINGTPKLVWEAESIAEAAEALRRWRERRERACPQCGAEAQPSGDGVLVCPTCELAKGGGSP